MNFRAFGRGALLLGLLSVFFAVQAMAVPPMAKKTGAACASCHVNVAGGAELTDVGKGYKADETKLPVNKGTANEYMGANKCRTCHSKQMKAWTDTKHAKAFHTLQTVDDKTAAEWATRLGVELKGKASESEACIGCHVTGHQLPGGFPAADSTLNANVSMVGCESCHGPGTAHKAAAKEAKKGTTNNAVGEALCVSCHTAKASPGFKYAEMKGKVHPVPTE
jgi:nitrate/TMAO reductase-like tetraheme cytochrome c subunit